VVTPAKLGRVGLTILAQDFDISGSWDPMIPDAEIISLLCTLLTRLDVGEFTVKVCC
jgi:histidyl-tRNA synthetase